MSRRLLAAGVLLLSLTAPRATAADRVRVLEFLESWSAAWQAQQLEPYLAHYAERTRVGSRDRAQLAAHKAQLFERGERIELRLGDVSVDEEGDLLRVSFLQDYRSASLSDFGRKELLVRPSAGSFLIVEELWQPAPGPIGQDLAEQLGRARAEALPPTEQAVQGEPPASTPSIARDLPPEPVFTPLTPRGETALVPGAADVEPLLGEGYAPPIDGPQGEAVSGDLLAIEPLLGPAPSFLQPVSFPGLPGDIEDRTLVEEVVARVNGRVLTRSEFVERLEGRHLQLMLDQAPDLRARLAALVPETLLLTVERWLLVQEADVDRVAVEQFWRARLNELRKEAGAETLEELEKLLQAEGMTLTTLREQVLAQEVVFQKVTSRIDRSEERLREFYAANGDRYGEPARVSLRQILVPVESPSDLPRAEAAVSAAVEQLASGTPWCEVHAVYGEGGVACGDIGNLALDDLLPELREAAAGLPIEAISKPIRTSAGLHVLQVLERSEVGVPPLEQVRARVEADVLDEGFERRLEDFLEALKATAVIEINPRYAALWQPSGVGQ